FSVPKDHTTLWRTVAVLVRRNTDRLDGSGAGCHHTAVTPVCGRLFLLTTPFIEPPRLRFQRWLRDIFLMRSHPYHPWRGVRSPNFDIQIQTEFSADLACGFQSACC